MTEPEEISAAEYVALKVKERKPSDNERFWGHVVFRDEESCWDWVGYTDRNGYGLFSHSSTTVTSHRYAYEDLVGTIPRGLQIDHLCRNRSCVNPAHMEPVTARENILRGDSPAAIASRTGYCQRGHELTPDNLYTRTGSARSGRQCRRCLLDGMRRKYQERKVVAIDRND